MKRFVPLIVLVLVAGIIGGVLWYNHVQDQHHAHDVFCAIERQAGTRPPGCP